MPTPTPRDQRNDRLMAAALVVSTLVEFVALGDLYADNSIVTSRQPDGVALVLAWLTVLPLAVRRTRPLLTLVVSHLFYTVLLYLDYAVPTSGQIAVLAAFYGIAIWAEPTVGDRARWAIAAFMTAFTTLGVIATDIPVGVIPLSLGVYAATAVAGNVSRTRMQMAADAERRALEAETHRERRAQEAVFTERARIARELHDVVAHGITVMTVQAAGARKIVASDPDQAVTALEAIEQTGRESLREMRRMIGVMRETPDASDRTPQPGLDAIPNLVAQLADGGLEVTVNAETSIGGLPAGVELTAFRIIQEALTNTLKHGGPNATAEVTIAIGAGGLEIDVTDTGRGSTSRTHEGHGLLGMQERVALFGGEFVAGGRRGGGFRVHATLPLAREAS